MILENNKETPEQREQRLNAATQKALEQRFGPNHLIPIPPTPMEVIQEIVEIGNAKTNQISTEKEAKIPVTSNVQEKEDNDNDSIVSNNRNFYR